MLTTLFDFKRDYDRNAPLEVALPPWLPGPRRCTAGWASPTSPAKITRPCRETGQMARHAGALPANLPSTQR